MTAQIRAARWKGLQLLDERASWAHGRRVALRGVSAALVRVVRLQRDAEERKLANDDNAARSRRRKCDDADVRRSAVRCTRARCCAGAL